MLNYCQPIYLALGCKEQMSTCGRCFQWALAGEYKCGHRPAVPVLSCLLLPSFLFLGHPPTGMPTWRAAQGWATVTAWWGGGGVELGALSCPPHTSGKSTRSFSPLHPAPPATSSLTSQATSLCKHWVWLAPPEQKLQALERQGHRVRWGRNEVGSGGGS